MNKFCAGDSTDSSLCSTAVTAEGGQWQGYTPEQISALVNLVSNIAARYNIPLDREHIIGHYQITTKKTDPGPAFPWNEFMKQLKEKQGISGVQEMQDSTSKNLPQGVSRSFYTVDKNGNQYIVQVLAIVKKTEKNV
jgi:N-acetyl-anhydromuramyl-L-alanine amidase AmpD